MNVVILSVGDELIVGQTVDTNSAWLSSQLITQGCLPLYHKTIGDDINAIVDALHEASGKAGLIVVTGGLGPTEDDMTRQALAKALNQPLILDESSLATIEGYFRSIGRDMPATNRVQAMYPHGAKILPNPWGTAPGIHAQLAGSNVYIFPGVPREMRNMFERYVSPYLRQATRRFIITESVTTFGAGESIVAQSLGELMERSRNPVIGTTVSSGEVTVRVRSDFATHAEALRECAASVAEIKKRLGDWIVGIGGGSLAEATVQLARQVGVRVAVAESCTGGLLSKLLTDISGASDVFLGGWVTYANDLKINVLGVNPELLAREGAVSEAVSIEMAVGALKQSGADYALALTGIAGPNGGTEGKPVGTVWMAMAFRQDGKVCSRSEHCLFPGDRDMIRLRSAKTAINSLRLALMGGSI
jgi:nicotinamide-nucleotide amidase